MKTISLMEIKKLQNNYSELSNLATTLNDFEYKLNDLSDSEILQQFYLSSKDRDKICEVINILEMSSNRIYTTANKNAKLFVKAF